MINNNERDLLCKTMASSLPMLRAKLAWPQDDLAKRLDVTRQTISAFESGNRKLPWSMFLALTMLFYANPSTNSLLEALEIFNDDLRAFLAIRC